MRVLIPTSAGTTRHPVYRAPPVTQGKRGFYILLSLMTAAVSVYVVVLLIAKCDTDNTE